MKKVPLFLFILGLLMPASAVFSADTLVPQTSEPTKSVADHECWVDLFKSGLFRADETPVPLSALTEKEYIGVYCSASWCGPCCAFTPHLVEFYHEFKDKIEIVLISNDRSKELAFKYMKDYKQPWLTSQFGVPETYDYIRRNKILGIPNFRVYKKDGTLVLPNGRNLDAVRKVLSEK